jgi:hypothetical protein
MSTTNAVSDTEGDAPRTVPRRTLADGCFWDKYTFKSALVVPNDEPVIVTAAATGWTAASVCVTVGIEPTETMLPSVIFPEFPLEV